MTGLTDTREMELKAIIVYYFQGGNTEYAAEKLAAGIGADLLRIEPRKAYPSSGFRKFFWGGKSAVMAEAPELAGYSFDGSAYDEVIFGFPVWAGTFAPPIRTFVRENTGALKDKKLSAFACQSGAGAEKAFAGLEKCLGRGLDHTLILIDPKDKPGEANEKAMENYIKEFTKTSEV